ncbi:DUF7500 family protein [Halegenticoccus tardaugens]|uniref:DUF7500 family protein n=1 Tax=Halegenticoccus tardaugens TaxID=2071624 RepID=UPI00100A3FBC|nr:hypothetical protein [Halegenticoccus tardaugens]
MPPDPTDDEREGPVLSPDDLDIDESDRIVELDEGRYLIPTGDGDPAESDGGSGSRDADAESDDAPPDAGRGETDPGFEFGAVSDADETGDVDAAAVGRWLAGSLSHDGFAYGFDATLKVDGSISRHRLVSNDVAATFETLLLWYARQVGDDTPPEKVLGILLAESDLPIALPPRALHAVLRHYGLDRDDPIADLLAAVGDDG